MTVVFCFAEVPEQTGLGFNTTMREIHPKILSWLAAGDPWVLATVVKAGRPSPRRTGAVMAIRPRDQLFHGSVSAGCVESAVIELAGQTLEDGRTRWESFGGEAGFPWEVGLTCGGAITVRMDRIDPRTDAVACGRLADILQDGREGISLMVAGRFRCFAVEHLAEQVEGCSLPVREAVCRFSASRSMLEESQTDEGEALLYRIARPRRLFMVGAGHIALHLVPIAHQIGLETVVIDPRAAYLRPERFMEPPWAVHACWPDAVFAKEPPGPLDAAVLLTHDPKIDDAALTMLLAGACGYIGVLGSERSHRARRQRLLKLGFAEQVLDRIDAPIGLDIGSRTPSEIAVSIAAGLIQHQNRNEAYF